MNPVGPSGFFGMPNDNDNDNKNDNDNENKNDNDNKNDLRRRKGGAFPNKIISARLSSSDRIMKKGIKTVKKTCTLKKNVPQ